MLRGDEYVDQGLRIVHRDGLNIHVRTPDFIGADNFNSAPNAIGFTGPLVGGEPSDHFDFIFTDPVHASGLWIGNVGPGSTEVQFLAPDLSVIASEIFTEAHEGLVVGDDGNRVFYGLVSDRPIARIRTVEPGDDLDGILYDDIQFKAVPEPATFGMLVIGALTLVHARRRIAASA